MLPALFQLAGDGIRNLDLSLSKEFTIREGMLVQIRAEVFNVANLNASLFLTPARAMAVSAEYFPRPVTSARCSSERVFSFETDRLT